MRFSDEALSVVEVVLVGCKLRNIVRLRLI